MAQMERIIRPHQLPNYGPAEKPPKCWVPPENQVVKLAQDPGFTSAAPASGGGGSNAAPSPQKKTRNSAWSYSYKKYMTKKEKEITEEGDEDNDGVVDCVDDGEKGSSGGSGTPVNAGTPV